MLSKVEVPATIQAVSNGDPTCHDSCQTDNYKAFHGQCILIIKLSDGAKGMIKVSAKSEGLLCGELSILAK